MKNVETVMSTMAQAVASAQLRSASRHGSADVDALMKFSLNSFWQAELVHVALEYVTTMKNYFKEYRKVYRDKGLTV
jgi:hypothetical protein